MTPRMSAALLALCLCSWAPAQEGTPSAGKPASAESPPATTAEARPAASAGAGGSAAEAFPPAASLESAGNPLGLAPSRAPMVPAEPSPGSPRTDFFPEEGAPGIESWTLRRGDASTVPGVVRAAAGDPRTLEVEPLLDGSGVVVRARGTGVSDLLLWDAEARPGDPPRRVRVSVRGRGAEAVRREIEALLAYTSGGLLVRLAGPGTLVVTGSALERSDRARLEKILAAYGSEPGVRVLDFTAGSGASARRR